MHSCNLCIGAYHLTKFLVLDSVSRSTSYFRTLTFHLCFGFETVIYLDQYTGLVPCVLTLCLHLDIVLRMLIVVLSVRLSFLVCIYIIFDILTQLIYFQLLLFLMLFFGLPVSLFICLCLLLLFVFCCCCCFFGGIFHQILT